MYYPIYKSPYTGGVLSYVSTSDTYLELVTASIISNCYHTDIMDQLDSGEPILFGINDELYFNLDSMIVSIDDGILVLDTNASDDIHNHRKIMTFLSRLRDSHPDMVKLFTGGACINLYTMLKAIFPNAIPYYNVDHIITKIGSRYYDITGQVAINDRYMRYDKYYDKKGLKRSFRQMYRYVNKNIKLDD